MFTYEMAIQRLLLLKLRLKHKFTIIEFINLAEIKAEIKDLKSFCEGEW